MPASISFETRHRGPLMFRHPGPAGAPVPWGMADGAFPRSLTSSERAVIEVILSASEGRDALRCQLDHTQVVGTWAAGPSIDLQVPAGLPRHLGADGILPTLAQVRDASGDAVGELLLWIADGSLSALEYAWYADDPPSGLPEAVAVEVDRDGVGG